MENSFQRSMQILDLFSEERALISYHDVVEAFGFTKSSAYRYLGNLTDAGFIAAVGNGLYSLGPRVIELERLIVLSDPLLASGRKLMSDLADTTPNSALLLCSLWGERVLCIHEVRSSTTDASSPPFVPRRGRGIPYTLYEGAPSIVLLANLPAYRLRSLFKRDAGEIASHKLGNDWREFSDTMGEIRTKGYAMSVDTFHTGRIAVAVPVYDASRRVAGCLARVAAIEAGVGEAQAEEIAAQLILGADAIAAEMERVLSAHRSSDKGQAGLFRSATPLPE